MDRLTIACASLSLVAHAAFVRAMPLSAGEAARSPPADTTELWDAPMLDEQAPEPAAEPELEELDPEVASEPDEAPSPLAEEPASSSTSEPPSDEAPPPAMAGETMTAEDEAGPVDFSLVQGTAGAYVGGVSSARGQGTKPGGRGASPAGEDRRGSGSGAKPAGPDRSESARPRQASWNCSSLFPAQADEAEVHHAVVQVIVDVSASGHAQRVRVVADPGHGFGAAARACALAQSYAPARDRAGTAMAATTAPFSIRFTR